MAVGGVCRALGPPDPSCSSSLGMGPRVPGSPPPLNPEAWRPGPAGFSFPLRAASQPSGPAPTWRPPGCVLSNGFPCAGATGPRAWRSVALPISRNLQGCPGRVRVGDACTSRPLRGQADGGPVARPAWDSHVTPGPPDSGKAQQHGAPGSAKEFRLMAVLHHVGQPPLPPQPLPPPFAEGKRPRSNRARNKNQNTRERPGQCPSSLRPAWRLPGLGPTLGGGGEHSAFRGSCDLTLVPGQRAQPRCPRWTHGQ